MIHRRWVFLVHKRNKISTTMSTIERMRSQAHENSGLSPEPISEIAHTRIQAKVIFKGVSFISSCWVCYFLFLLAYLFRAPFFLCYSPCWHIFSRGMRL